MKLPLTTIASEARWEKYRERPEREPSNDQPLDAHRRYDRNTIMKDTPMGDIATAAAYGSGGHSHSASRRRGRRRRWGGPS